MPAIPFVWPPWFWLLTTQTGQRALRRRHRLLEEALALCKSCAHFKVDCEGEKLVLTDVEPEELKKQEELKSSRKTRVWEIKCDFHELK